MVRRLGEILLDRGLITVEELHVALEACHRTGGRLGTHLLRRGFIDEPGLLQALSEQFHLPPVTAATLRQAGQQVRSLIPLDLQRRALVVAFERRGNGVSVAMVNPRDLETREDIEAMTGLAVRPYVATETAIMETLELEADAVADLGTSQGETQIRIPSHQEWDALWLRPRLDRSLLPGLKEHHPHRRGKAAALAAFPELTPLLGAEGNGVEQRLDASTYRAGLLRAHHRDEVGRLLVAFARLYLERVVLLSLHRGAARGWMASGEALVPDDIQTFEIALDCPGVLADLSVGPRVHVGPVPAVGSCAGLLEVLGEPMPIEMIILPVRVKERVIAFLAGDIPGTTIRKEIIGDLSDGVERAGVALEILILRRKL